MKTRSLLLVCVFGVALALPGLAMYRRLDIQKAPIPRLVTNLEKQIVEDPKQVEPRYALARVYSMAYALKADEFDVKTNGSPFFGMGSSSGYFQPRQVKPAASPEKEAEAQAFLKKAIENYREAVTLDPRHMPSQLGLGWCLDKAGEKKAALEAYRKALDLAWEAEKAKPGLEQGASATEETAGYMLKLLDTTADANEIKTVQGYQAELKKKPRWMTPIFIPLVAGASFAELVNEQASVAFDLDGSGLQRQWQWLAPKAGWLVYDADGRGEITSGLQLFGSATFWIFWENGYHALASLDNDRDGVLAGEELNHLGVWQDFNSDGKCDPGEVQPLSAWGIVGLRYSYARQGDVLTCPQGVVLKDGATRPSYDWMVRSR